MLEFDTLRVLNRKIQIGSGAGFSITDDEVFEYRLLVSVFYHMPFLN